MNKENTIKHRQTVTIPVEMADYVFEHNFFKRYHEDLARAIVEQVADNELKGIHERELSWLLLAHNVEHNKFTADLPESLESEEPCDSKYDFCNWLFEKVDEIIHGMCGKYNFTLTFEWENTWEEDEFKIQANYNHPEGKNVLIETTKNFLIENNVDDIIVKVFRAIIWSGNKLLKKCEGKLIVDNDGVLKVKTEDDSIGDLKVNKITSSWSSGEFTADAQSLMNPLLYFDLDIKFKDKNIGKKLYDVIYAYTPNLRIDED